MACGRPVVGVRAGAVAELVDDEVGITAARAEGGLFAQAVRDLYDRDIDALGRSRARPRAGAVQLGSRAAAAAVTFYAGLSEKKRTCPMPGPPPAACHPATSRSCLPGHPAAEYPARLRLPGPGRHSTTRQSRPAEASSAPLPARPAIRCAPRAPRAAAARCPRAPCRRNPTPRCCWRRWKRGEIAAVGAPAGLVHLALVATHARALAVVEVAEIDGAIGEPVGGDFGIGAQRQRQRRAFQHELRHLAVVDAIHEQRAIAGRDDFVAAAPEQMRQRQLCPPSCAAAAPPLSNTSTSLPLAKASCWPSRARQDPRASVSRDAAHARQAPARPAATGAPRHPARRRPAVRPWAARPARSTPGACSPSSCTRAVVAPTRDRCRLRRRRQSAPAVRRPCQRHRKIIDARGGARRAGHRVRAHARQAEKPASSSSRSSLRPMNTSWLDARRSPQGRSGRPSNIMCTPWNT